MATRSGTGGTARLSVVRSPLLDLPHGFSTRVGGVSGGRYTSLNLGPKSGDAPENVRVNRERLMASLGLTGVTVLAPRQVHSAAVAMHHQGEPFPSGNVFDGDGIVTDAPGVALSVLAADCAAVLLHDPVRGVIGAVHAGWRGTAGAISAAAVAQMVDGFGSNPADIRAAIGPAIGRCCYEVGPEVVVAIEAATPGGVAPLCDPLPDGKARIDIGAANVAQLGGAGVRPERISTAGICTACRTDRCFSHRREGEPTGRNAAVIALGP